ncbi:MAG: ferrochelatase [SAR324 cluster bacterium]|uniref:Ferrochelatase n=1 Tax=SAR324 cluster bacterium TaxID=2024889 RepID=A0A7X9FS63_9DELT|nr:ferrochelatase [SAR324 cluster bacterium]
MIKTFSQKIGVLIAQLGTPDEPTPSALRRYLKEFLSDSRVVGQSGLLWWFLLNGIILPLRSRRSARLYKEIWTDEGSPLCAITRKQAESLQEALGDNFVVDFGMRYGNPSLGTSLRKLSEDGCESIILFPMYPQYSNGTSASAYEAVFKALLKLDFIPALTVLPPYYENDHYIKALSQSINEALEASDGKAERLILSYHGLPLKFIEAGDPYHDMCKATTAKLKPLLKLEQRKILHCYQSRFGRKKWLEPCTSQTLKALAKEGVKQVAVACPGFLADCLETLSEVAIEMKNDFLSKGGKSFNFIPCLNAQECWIQGMKELIIARTPHISLVSSPSHSDGRMSD